jgi:hypothetical protein
MPRGTFLKISMKRPPESQTQHEQTMARNAAIELEIRKLRDDLYALHSDKFGLVLSSLEQAIKDAPEGSETRGIALKLLAYETTPEGREVLSGVLIPEVRAMYQQAPYSNYTRPAPKYSSVGRPQKNGPASTEPTATTQDITT